MTADSGLQEKDQTCAVHKKPKGLMRVMSSVLAGLCVLAAISVVIHTNKELGPKKVALIILFSLAYFVVELVRVKSKWVGGDPASTWYWIKGMPSFLDLGIIALVVKIFFNHSEMELRAYPLRILFVVGAFRLLFDILSRLRSLLTSRLDRLGLAGQRREWGWLKWLATDSITAAVWKSKNALPRFILSASYLLNALIWTWLVVYYRYYSPSFLTNTPWAMAALWMFLISGWVGAIAVVLSQRSIGLRVEAQMRI